MSNKALEIYSIIMTITKKSIKIVEKNTKELVGSNDDLTHFKLGNKFINLSDDEKLAKQEEYKKQYGTKRSTKICELSECNDFQTMITLTFKPEDNQSEEQVKYNWALAKKRLEFRHGKFKYICALERGTEQGHLHFHIITDISHINNHSEFWNDTNKKNVNWAEDDILNLIVSTSNRSKALKDKRIELYNDGASYLKVLLGFGHVHVKKINDEDVKYICKYISKDTELNSKYKRTIWTSRNLEKPVRFYTDDVIDYLLENRPTEKYEYKQTAFSWKDTDYEIINVQTLTYKDISDYYYMCKTANTGNEIYMKEMAFINKKSYEYTFNLFNPKKNIDKDYSYYENLYKVNKNKIKERVV